MFWRILNRVRRLEDKTSLLVRDYVRVLNGYSALKREFDEVKAEIANMATIAKRLRDEVAQLKTVREGVQRLIQRANEAAQNAESLAEVQEALGELDEASDDLAKAVEGGTQEPFNPSQQ